MLPTNKTQNKTARAAGRRAARRSPPMPSLRDKTNSNIARAVAAHCHNKNPINRLSPRVNPSPVASAVSAKPDKSIASAQIPSRIAITRLGCVTPRPRRQPGPDAPQPNPLGRPRMPHRLPVQAPSLAKRHLRARQVRDRPRSLAPRGWDCSRNHE